MKILLICANGLSTSLLVSNMKKHAEQDMVIEAKPMSELSRVVDQWDVILVGPQIRYKIGEINKICNAHGKKAGIIDTVVYGRMDGAAALKQARELAVS